jgi:rRNA maturation RNase YbeY
MPTPRAASKRLEGFLQKARTHAALARRLKLDRKLEWRAELQLVDGPTMTELNDTYRGKPQPTDVLSFPAPAPFHKLGVLGELVICKPVLTRQAKEQGHSPAAELDVLLVHGLLHLLGWDHEKSAREAAAMARWERALLPKKSGLIARTQKKKLK